MSTRTISTKLAVEGEAQYKQSISACSAELKTMKSELALVESEFRNNANSLEALTKKNDALGSIFQKQEEKISTLEKALKNAQDAYETYASRVSTAQGNIERYEQALESLKNSTGDTTEEQEALTKELDKWNAELEEAQAGQAAAERGVQNWQKQLNDAKIDLNKLSDSIDENGQYLHEAEQSADGCAKSIDEFGKEVKDAEENTDSFSGKLKNGLVGAFEVAGASIVTVGTAAVAGLKFLNDIAESTEEYRIAQGKLNTAFEAAGYSTETAKAAYQDLFSVLGDTDNATESAQLLAQLAKSEEDIATWGEIAAGVTGTFGDALPINSLIEAANETAKVGQVTGVLADALNWVSISEDEFNEKLAACADETERTNLITETLSGTYKNASDIFKENNSVLMDANRAQVELNDSMARLGGMVAEVKTELMAEFAPSIAEVSDALIGLAEGSDGASEAFAQAIDGLIGKAAEKLPELLEFGSDIIINVISGITNAAPQLVEGAVAAITSLAEGLIAVLPQLAEAGSQLISGLAAGIADAAPELIPAAAETVTQLVNAIVSNVPLLVDGGLQLVTGMTDGVLEAIPVLLEAAPELTESFIGALLEAIPKLAETGVKLLTSLVDNLPEIIHTIVTSLPEIISSIVNTILDDIPTIAKAGVELLTALVASLPQIISEIVMALPAIITGMVDALSKGVSKFEDVGGQLVRGLWNGIQSLAGWLWDKVYGWVQSIWTGITDFFGIASPSRQMAWVGEMLVEGLAGAVSVKGKDAVDAVEKMASGMLSEAKIYASDIQKAMDIDYSSLVATAKTLDEFEQHAEQKNLTQRLNQAAQEISAAEKAYLAGENYVHGLTFDVQSILGSVDDEKQNFSAAYESLAQAALSSMERHLPSVVEVPAPSLELSRQTAAIVDAVSSREALGGPIQIHVDKLEVRSDSDVHRIAQELYYMTEREKRSRGGTL